MNIIGVKTTAYLDFTRKVSSNKATDMDKEFAMEGSSEKSSDPIMDLYKEICSKYKDVSFRLDDREAALEYEKAHGTDGCGYLGYNNSMNQVGENFGRMSQKSVEIDASVLKKCIDDPQYKKQLMNRIDEEINRYSQWQYNAYDLGATNMCIGFVDEGEGIAAYAVNANSEFSTEEEIKAMWNFDALYTAYLEKSMITSNNMLYKALGSEDSVVDETGIKLEKMNENGEKLLHIMWTTDEGMFCRRAGQTEGYEWSILFSNPSQRQLVENYLKSLDKDEELPDEIMTKEFWLELFRETSEIEE